MIYALQAQDGGIYMRVAAGSVQNLKPELVTEAFLRYLGEKPEDISFTHHRLDTFADRSTSETPDFVPLDALGTEIV